LLVSALITVKFLGDTDTFRKTLTDRADASFAEQARAAGGIHHRFGIGDGFVVVVDEWESPQQFEQFFARPELQAFIGSSGASGPPEITVCEAIASPDQY
jgi:quinol monooxygenase YgiN